MITIILNTPRKVTFKKSDQEEPWFDHDCSNERLLKECGRECDKIKRIQFGDDGQIANLLHVYFEEETIVVRHIPAITTVQNLEKSILQLHRNREISYNVMKFLFLHATLIKNEIAKIP
jgi:hypothetical protein